MVGRNPAMPISQLLGQVDCSDEGLKHNEVEFYR